VFFLHLNLWNEEAFAFKIGNNKMHIRELILVGLDELLIMFISFE